METLKEFFAAVRERLSSPLIGSFVITWCIANWKLFVALAFLDENGYAHFNKKNAVDYATDYLSNEVHWGWPLLISLAYSFGYPFVKSIIRAARDKADVISEDWNLKIVQNSKVDTSKYLALRKRALSKEKELQTLIDEETTVREKLAATELDLSTKKQLMENLRLDHEKATLEHNEELKTLQGRLSDTLNYSIVSEIESITYHAPEDKTALGLFYQFKFTVNRDLQRLFVVERVTPEKIRRMEWSIFEHCCDSQRKTSFLTCTVAKDSKIDKHWSIIEDAPFPDQFSMLIKELDTPTHAIRIILADSLKNIKLIPLSLKSDEHSKD